MIPVENLVNEYDRLTKSILEAMKKQSELVKQINSASKEQYDWISVKVASERLSVTPQYLYTRKDLEHKRIGSKIFLRWSQCSKINDNKLKLRLGEIF